MTEKEELKLFASIIGLLCYEDNTLSTERVVKTNSKIKSFGIIKIEFSSKEKARTLYRFCSWFSLIAASFRKL